MNTPTLTLDASLNNAAQQWAEHMANTGSFAHDPNAQQQGENLFWRRHSGITDCEGYYQQFADYYDVTPFIQSCLESQRPAS